MAYNIHPFSNYAFTMKLHYASSQMCFELCVVQSVKGERKIIKKYMKTLIHQESQLVKKIWKKIHSIYMNSKYYISFNVHINIQKNNNQFSFKL